MLRHAGRAAADRPAPDAVGPTAERPQSVDAVHVRNYDHRRGHSAHVTVTDADGRPAQRERCYLAPGQSRRLLAAVRPGEHRVRVRVDGVERVDARLRLDASPTGTAVVELGRGVVSVVDGPDDLTAD